MYSNQAQPVSHVHRADLRVVTEGAGQSIALENPSSGLHDQMQALSHVAREQLARRWSATHAHDTAAKPKRVYYLSMEFLMGRSLSNALDALELKGPAAQALQAHAHTLEDAMAHEPDAALGNGGLGRLAACFLDSMATLGLPSYGYGLRYEFGMFAQRLEQGTQTEGPDAWLVGGTPWEFPRVDATYTVRLGGTVEQVDGKPVWTNAQTVLARAHDMVVPGHGTERVSTLRLWKALAPQALDLQAFNAGDIAAAAAYKNQCESISWVLYPNDSTEAGRELRLKQEYFLVSAAMQDLLKRHLRENTNLLNLPEKVSIHLNDTHPAMSVAELMRLLCDEHNLPWDTAWALCQQTFSYTNHTLMPEALETWPVALMQRLLPRHLEIIYRINHDFLRVAAAHKPDDHAFLSRLSLIDESGERRVRMANLSIVGSHRVNGVSALHSNLLVETLFADFASLWPDRFVNVTNGVTPRRWLAQCNPGLAGLLDTHIGTRWRSDLMELRHIAPLASDAEFRAHFQSVKSANKARLAAYIAQTTGITVDPTSLFDVQVKRIHEYKRQLLNVLHVVTRYQAILAQPDADWQPRTVIFAGKAASSYRMAKAIIRLIHDVGQVVNHDARIGGKLKVVFIPNYGVSVAEIIMPGADLSEQISTAGTEASGTGNMKLSMNGALTIGTDDGANIEIRQAVGDDNIFIFGLKTPEVAAWEAAGYDSHTVLHDNPALRAVLDAIAGGAFSPDEPTRYQELVDSLLGHKDRYFLLADHASYCAAQLRVDALYRRLDDWTRCAIANVAAMGVFSSDHTIAQYARDIWNVAPSREAATDPH
jgi:starch phosphorylase|nr:glycogen/starch/alpha-glucan phosphorylase [Rhodoferax sp.]